MRHLIVAGLIVFGSAMSARGAVAAETVAQKEKRLSIVRDFSTREDAKVLRSIGVDWERERAAAQALAHASASEGELREALARYRELVEYVTERTEYSLGGVPVAVYQLPMLAFEALQAKVGAAKLTAAERLEYADWTGKSSNPLDAGKAAAAYEAVLAAKPPREQELRALHGRHRALILVDQISGGRNRDIIVALTNAIRDRMSDRLLLVGVIQQTGHYFYWHGDHATARQYYLEAVALYPEMALGAKLRLRELDGDGGGAPDAPPLRNPVVPTPEHPQPAPGPEELERDRAEQEERRRQQQEAIQRDQYEAQILALRRDRPSDEHTWFVFESGRWSRRFKLWFKAGPPVKREGAWERSLAVFIDDGTGGRVRTLPNRLKIIVQSPGEVVGDTVRETQNGTATFRVRYLEEQPAIDARVEVVPIRWGKEVRLSRIQPSTAPAPRWEFRVSQRSELERAIASARDAAARGQKLAADRLAFIQGYLDTSSEAEALETFNLGVNEFDGKLSAWGAHRLLRQMGRTGEARQRAAELRKEHPESVVAQFVGSPGPGEIWWMPYYPTPEYGPPVAAD